MGTIFSQELIGDFTNERAKRVREVNFRLIDECEKTFVQLSMVKFLSFINILMKAVILFTFNRRKHQLPPARIIKIKLVEFECLPGHRDEV